MSEIRGQPPGDTSPSSNDPSQPAPSPSRPPPKAPSLSNLRGWLPLYMHKTDRVLERVHTILSTPAGIDTVLLTAGYSSLLTSKVLSSIFLSQLHSAATDLIKQIVALPPDTTVIIDTSEIPPSRLLNISQRLKALSSLISDFRIFVRLWGLIGIWKWGKGAYLNPPKDSVIRGIVYMQVASNVLFQFLENGAYLSSKGVAGWSSEGQNKAWLWSSRFWMAHVGLDFVRLSREWTLKRRNTAEKDGKPNSQESNSSMTDEAEWRANWLREFVKNLAWGPLTLHWSLEKGFLGDAWVGALGTVAGVVGLSVRWTETAYIV